VAISWRDLWQAIRFLVDLRGRWDRAAWEARLRQEEQRLNAERARLERLDQIARFDSQTVSARIAYRLAQSVSSTLGRRVSKDLASETGPAEGL
jgi:hypothetical protein